MPHRLVTIYVMLGRCQAPRPPSPPPLADIHEKEDDDEWHPKLAALHAKFRADEERYAVKEAVTEEHDNGDLDFSDDGPYPEEKAMEQSAIPASYESLKKAEADA
jgi:hypothetical protein